MTSSSHVDSKQLRNDLVTVCSLIAKISPDAPFIVSFTSQPPLMTLSLPLYLTGDRICPKSLLLLSLL